MWVPAGDLDSDVGTLPPGVELRPLPNSGPVPPEIDEIDVRS